MGRCKLILLLVGSMLAVAVIAELVFFVFCAPLLEFLLRLRLGQAAVVQMQKFLVGDIVLEPFQRVL